MINKSIRWRNSVYAWFLPEPLRKLTDDADHSSRSQGLDRVARIQGLEIKITAVLHQLLEGRFVRDVQRDDVVAGYPFHLRLGVARFTDHAVAMNAQCIGMALDRNGHRNGVETMLRLEVVYDCVVSRLHFGNERHFSAPG